MPSGTRSRKRSAVATRSSSAGGSGAARELERTAEPAAQWLAEHGTTIGARTQNVDERIMALGITTLVDAMRQFQLSEVDVDNAQGNAFDHEVLRHLHGVAVRSWLAGEGLALA